MNISAAARMPITAPLAAASAYAPIILVIAGTLLLTLSAKLQIPLWPVPMTMQTYVILVIAMAYGTRLGVATVITYLLAGALGLPVFAGTPGNRGCVHVRTDGGLLARLFAFHLRHGKARTTRMGSLLDAELRSDDARPRSHPGVRRCLVGCLVRLGARGGSRPGAVHCRDDFEDGACRIDASNCLALRGADPPRDDVRVRARCGRSRDRVRRGGGSPRGLSLAA